MSREVIGALIAAVLGVGVAVINYLISRYVLQRQPDKYALFSVLRQGLQIGLLVGVYFAARGLSVAVTWPLVGAAVGMTVPMLLLTHRLLHVNDKEKEKKEEDVSG